MVAVKSVLFAAASTAAFFCAPALAGVDARQWPSPAITAAVDDAVARYRLPGIAVGVVAGGEVRQVELRGDLEVGSGRAVTADALFKVASNTKAMTAALLARQVDAGLLAWDDPVVQHLPHFRMRRDWVTREMQVRDLLIHNSGLGPGAGDLMLWPEPNHFTREDVVAGLAHLEPRWSFRSRYAYDNTLYIVAGEVAAAAGGAPYDQLLRREVFAPLGMDGCRVGEWHVDESAPVAAAHVWAGDGWTARSEPAVVADLPMAAAGGVRCGLDDMLRWVRAWLDPGTVDRQGRPWLSVSQREAAWTAYMPMPVTARMREWNRSHFHAYGHGWRLSDVDGTAKVAHTGTLSGMYSAVTLLPELDVGFVILVNADAGEARTVLEQVVARSFTAPDAPRDVAWYAGAIAAEGEAGRTDGAKRPSPPPAAASRRPVTAAGLAPLLGRYRDPWFGEVAICASGNGVRFASHKSPRLSGPLLRAGGRLLVDFDTLGSDADAWLDFTEAGGGARLAMAKVEPDADFSYDYEDLAFTRVGYCAIEEAPRH